MWSKDGYLIGIVTYGTTGQGGKNDRNCRSINPSMYHMPSVMGLTIPASQGGQPVQQQPQPRTQRNRGFRERQYYDYDY
jgi:hypothetical protein